MNEALFRGRRAARLGGILLSATLLSACAEGPDFAFLQPKDKPEASDEKQASNNPTPRRAERIDVDGGVRFRVPVVERRRPGIRAHLELTARPWS